MIERVIRLPKRILWLCAATLKKHNPRIRRVEHSRKLLTIISLFALAISVSNSAWAFDETHLKKFKALNACMGCDLSKASLSMARLNRANLKEAELNGADLSKADLSGADLSGANLSRTNLEKPT